MQYKAVIFDMDGLLIDSEPLWQEAGKETLAQFGVVLTDEQYHSSTGLRTEEWVDHWFRHFGISSKEAPVAIEAILKKAIEKIDANGIALPGVDYILDFFTERHFRVGLATSSPMALVDVVADKLKIRNRFSSFSSAESLPYGKPHPLVFLNCAAALNCLPQESIVFEDSFNGMIAAKAARMKCVVVPAKEQYTQLRWSAADLVLPALPDFNEEKLNGL
jgi:mannitol-1-/sugar-/sorbitol-6-/2-deoxyglucose-6-phosphatase